MRFTAATVCAILFLADCLMHNLREMESPGGASQDRLPVLGKSLARGLSGK